MSPVRPKQEDPQPTEAGPEVENRSGGTTSTALVRPGADWWRPQTWEQAERQAAAFSKSFLVPAEYRNQPGNCLVAMIFGDAVGLNPLSAMQNLAVVNGKPRLYGDAIPALIKSAPAYVDMVEERIGEPGTDSYGWRCTMIRRGQRDVVREFTVADAKKAGLWEALNIDPEKRAKSPWVRYPDRMLQMRARGWSARDAWADRLSGIGIVEEWEDVQTAQAVVRDGQDTTGRAVEVAIARRAEPQPQKPAPTAVATEPSAPTAEQDAEEIEDQEPTTFEQKRAPAPSRVRVGDRWQKPDGELMVCTAVDPIAWSPAPKEKPPPLDTSDARPMTEQRVADGERIRSISKERRLGPQVLAQIAADLFSRPVFALSELTDAELRLVREELELRYGLSDVAKGLGHVEDGDEEP